MERKTSLSASYFACHSYVTRGLFVFNRISFLSHEYHLCVNRMYSYVIRMSLVCIRMSLVCYWYVFVCYSYVTGMYSYVIRTSLVYTRISLACICISFVCHSYVPVCHSYVFLPWTVTKLLIIKVMKQKDTKLT